MGPEQRGDYSQEIQPSIEPLSERESEALLLLVIGFDRPKIAEEMDVTPRTVDSFREKIRKKFQVRSTIDMVRVAIEQGFVDEQEISTEPLSTLSKRESFLLSELSNPEYKTSQDIADANELSVRTIEKHLQRIYNKLNVSTRQGAFAMYFVGQRRGEVPDRR